MGNATIVLDRDVNRTDASGPGINWLISLCQTSSSTNNDRVDARRSLILGICTSCGSLIQDGSILGASSFAMDDRGRSPQVWKITVSNAPRARHVNFRARVVLPLPGAPHTRTRPGLA